MPIIDPFISPGSIHGRDLGCNHEKKAMHYERIKENTRRVCEKEAKMRRDKGEYSKCPFVS